MRYVLSVLILGATLSCGHDSCGSSQPLTEADMKVVQPREIDDVLYNPGIGVELWHRAEWGATPENYPEVRLTYYRWYWSEIESERGQIRWDIFDRALDDAVATGARMGFRLMCVRGGQMQVPLWLAEKAGGFWYGDTFWPDFNNPVFMDEVERLMTAIGERYADHPGLNHVDMSFFGCWGEYNDACVPGRVSSAHMWSEETQKRNVDIHFASFPNVPILQLGTSDPAIGDYAHFVKGAGWRVDCFGDYGIFGTHWNHMEDYYLPIVQRYGDAWKRGMVSFEICGSLQNWVDKGFDFDLIMDKALEWHGSSINLKACNVPDEWMPKLLETLKYLGYRLRIREVEFPPILKRGESWPIRMEWMNDGVAPPYHIYILALELVPESGGVHWRHEAAGVDVREWLPGSHRVNLDLPVPGLAPGVYSLRVGLLCPHTKRPAIRLANAGLEEDGWYALSTVRIGE